jgi:hypothetical protein
VNPEGEPTRVGGHMEKPLSSPQMETVCFQAETAGKIGVSISIEMDEKPSHHCLVVNPHQVG